MIGLGTVAFVINLLAGLGGLSLAIYIRAKKFQEKPMVCPLGSNCSDVTESQYSLFLGIPVDLLGILYYVFIVTAYGFLLVVPGLATTPLVLVVFGASLLAFLFSLYLTFIQAFTLRKWCTWCLTSAALTTTIFLASIGSIDTTMSGYLATIKPWLIGGHLLGLAIGLGGATSSDYLFFRFLRDFRISKFEVNALHNMSQLIWVGLGLLFATGIGIFLSAPAAYIVSTKFLAKMFVVCVIAVNGAFLNLYVTPRLTRMAFAKHHHKEGRTLHKARHVAFALGAISMVSWYSAFILGLMRSSPVSLPALLTIYGIILGFAVMGSQAYERIMWAKASANPTPPDSDAAHKPHSTVKRGSPGH